MMFCKECRHYDKVEQLCRCPVPMWTDEYTWQVEDQENISYMPPEAICDRCAAKSKIDKLDLLRNIINAGNCICSGPGDIRCARCKAEMAYEEWKQENE